MEPRLQPVCGGSMKPPNTLFDKGDFISFANCGLPYYIGDAIKDRENLLIQTPQGFRQRFNVDVRIRAEVKKVDAAAKNITVQQAGISREEPFDVLLLAPGCMPVRPKLIGMDSPSCIPSAPFRIPTGTGGWSVRSVKNAVVIGGGFIGLEMAENLRLRGVEVTLIEMLDQVFVRLPTARWRRRSTAT